MKLLTLFILNLYIFSSLSCTEQPKRPSKSDGIKDNFSTQKKIQELRESGELFDSCQFPYQGNCFYRLCGSNDITSISDTLLVTPNSPILVAYVPYRGILTTNETDKTARLVLDTSFKIYSNVIYKEDYDDFVSKDISEAINRGESVSKKEEIQTSDLNKGLVYEFKVKSGQNFAISYIDISKYIVMIVFTADSNDAYTNNYWYFADLVKSFKYYGD